MAERRCLSCRAKAAKTELLRLVIDDTGRVWPDVLQKAPGRGAYLCWQHKCLTRLHDRQLSGAWKDRSVGAGQAAGLAKYAAQALLQLCRQYFQRNRRGLNVGRDAVMHRMWADKPMLVLLAGDAGAALKRQVHDACDKRKGAGLKTGLVIFADSATLGDLAGRDIVSVLALDDTVSCASLRQYCKWYEQVVCVADNDAKRSR